MMASKWEKIDWTKVGKEKALFLHQEAKENEHEVVAAINAMNQKAFNVLALTLPLLIVMVSALLSQWSVLNLDVRWAGLVMSVGLFLSATFLFIAVFPRGIIYAASPPDVYFSNDYYKKPMLDILHGDLMGAARDIEHNEKILKYRGNCVRIGFAVLLTITPLAVLTFILFSV